MVLGNLTSREHRVSDRVQGATEGLQRHLPALKISTLDTQGNAAQVATLVGKLLASHPATKVLIAAMDDASALAAKSALDSAGREVHRRG